MTSLRGFLVLFFFIGLGARLDLALLDQELVAAVLLSLFVLIGNPLIVLVIMGIRGYCKRTALLAGLTVAQISEFSLIFMAMGPSIGHVHEQALGLVTLVGLITIALCTVEAPVLAVADRAVGDREAHELRRSSPCRISGPVRRGVGACNVLDRRSIPSALP